MNSIAQAMTTAIAATQHVTLDNGVTYPVLSASREQVNGRDMTAIEIDQQNATASVQINRKLAVLANPLDYIDRLQSKASTFGNRALTNFTSTLSFYVVNALVWQHRKSQKAAPTESTIDWRNRAAADKEIDETTAEALYETAAHDPLPRVDGLQFIGAYKQLVFALEDKKLDNKQFRLPDPINTFNAMQNGVNQEAIDASYDSLAYEHIKSEAVKRRLHARETDRTAATKERNATKLRFELDYVLGEIATTQPEPFTDDLWNQLPLYVQFRTLVAIQKQVMEAFLTEMKKPTADRVNEFDLGELADEMQLELSSVITNAEIVQAFDEGKLDAVKHSIQ